MEIKKIDIAGAGLMGAGMSQIFAHHGYDVVVYDAFDAALEKGKRLVELNQAAQVEAGEVTDAEAARTLAALRFTSELDALADLSQNLQRAVQRLRGMWQCDEKRVGAIQESPALHWFDGRFLNRTYRIVQFFNCTA